MNANWNIEKIEKNSHPASIWQLCLGLGIPKKFSAFRISPSIYPWRQGENICHEPELFEIHKNVWRFERMIIKPSYKNIYRIWTIVLIWTQMLKHTKNGTIKEFSKHIIKPYLDPVAWPGLAQKLAWPQICPLKNLASFFFSE